MVAVTDIATTVVHDERRIESRFYVIPRSHSNIHLASFQAVNYIANIRMRYLV